jgi:hypothetical protein
MALLQFAATWLYFREQEFLLKANHLSAATLDEILFKSIKGSLV